MMPGGVIVDPGLLLEANMNILGWKCFVRIAMLPLDLQFSMLLQSFESSSTPRRLSSSTPSHTTRYFRCA